MLSVQRPLSKIQFHRVATPSGLSFNFYKPLFDSAINLPTHNMSACIMQSILISLDLVHNVWGGRAGSVHA